MFGHDFPAWLPSFLPFLKPVKYLFEIFCHDR